MSFIGINIISDNNFIDDKDDYEVEDFESPSAAFYFIEKPNSDWQDKLLERLLGDWVNSDGSNDLDNNIDISHLLIKLMHHHNTNNIGSSGARDFHYASPSAYLFFDT